MGLKSQSPETARALLFIHFSVFLWGFTAILGKLITISQFPLVLIRMGITSVSLLFLTGLFRHLRSIPAPQRLRIASIGIIVAIHWVAFYGAIKVASITMALTCLSTTSFFVSFFEPLILKTKYQWTDSLLGIFIVPAIYLLQTFSEAPILGLALGLVAAALSGLFSVLNKTLVDKHHPYPITFLQLSTGFLFLCLLIPIYSNFVEPLSQGVPTHTDWLWLALLAIGCTTLPYILALKALKFITPFTSAITLNLEPIYGIILGVLIFKDESNLHPNAFLGAALVVLIVFIHPLLVIYRNCKATVKEG